MQHAESELSSKRQGAWATAYVPLPRTSAVTGATWNDAAKALQELLFHPTHLVFLTSSWYIFPSCVPARR